MKPLLITLVALVTMTAQVAAELITTGTALARAQMALAEARHTKSGLEMSVMPSDMALDFWTVGDGILIIVYSPATGLITSLSFTVMDERPKSTRKEFYFPADSFDTATGKLVLSTKKPR
ncbi:MAG: hypothetical protein JNM99_16220 [Verrucomicrobiaceae bacterium]|nr:hypothetical protein [Verrucomicrobiaceae bacterium]